MLMKLDLIPIWTGICLIYTVQAQLQRGQGAIVMCGQDTWVQYEDCRMCVCPAPNAMARCSLKSCDLRTKDSGKCPPAVLKQNQSNVCPGDGSNKLGTCKTDNDCPGPQLCCFDFCNGARCVDPLPLATRSLGGVATLSIGALLLYQSVGIGSDAAEVFLVENAYNASEGTPGGDGFYGISIVLIALGSLVTFISFLGCCGAFVSSRCLLLCYLASVTMILTLQLVASVFAIIFQQPMKETIHDELRIQMRIQYIPNSTYAAAWNFVQEKLQCCGVEGYSDWYHVPTLPQDSVPDSCCRYENYTGDTSCGRVMNPAVWYKQGCFAQIQLKTLEQLHIIALAILAVVFLQLYGIIASILLFYHAKSLRPRRVSGSSTPYKSYAYERAGMF